MLLKGVAFKKLPRSAWLTQLKLSFQITPFASCIQILFAICQCAASWIALVTSKIIVDQLTNRTASWAQVFPNLIWLVGALLFTPISGSLAFFIQSIQRAKFLTTIHLKVAKALLKPDIIDPLQNAELAPEANALVEATKGMPIMETIDCFWLSFRIRISGVPAIILLISWNWWATLLVAVTFILDTIYTGRYINLVLSNLVEGNTERGFAEYYRQLGISPASAKEVRIFRLGPWLTSNMRYWNDKATGSEHGHLRKAGLPVFMIAVAILLSTGITTMLLLKDSWSQVITVGSVVMLIQAILYMGGSLGSLGDLQALSIAGGKFLLQLNRFEEKITSYTSTINTTQSAVALSSTQPSRKTQALAIELTDVSYRYPGQEKWVLNHLNLSVPPGQSIAIVGANGAGKSTLMALLVGLHKPDSGKVLVGGKPASSARKNQPKAAVIFQEFARYPLDVIDNVLLGRNRDEAKAKQALQLAGASKIVGRLNGDLNTVLSSGYVNGTDLSGGQWQRVALARALSAIDAGAGILILDEPTSALDVRAESELFSHFLKITSGITTVLVSHRLSSVRHAQRILVLSEGKIVEDGSHEQLMALGGIYYEMFTIQASRFAISGDPDREDPVKA